MKNPQQAEAQYLYAIAACPEPRQFAAPAIGVGRRPWRQTLHP